MHPCLAWLIAGEGITTG